MSNYILLKTWNSCFSLITVSFGTNPFQRKNYIFIDFTWFFSLSVTLFLSLEKCWHSDDEDSWGENCPLVCVLPEHCAFPFLRSTTAVPSFLDGTVCPAPGSSSPLSQGCPVVKLSEMVVHYLGTLTILSNRVVIYHIVTIKHLQCS